MATYIRSHGLVAVTGSFFYVRRRRSLVLLVFGTFFAAAFYQYVPLRVMSVLKYQIQCVRVKSP